jgi:hypothetical protein
MRIIKNIGLPDPDQPGKFLHFADFMLAEGTTFTHLQREKSPLTQQIYVDGKDSQGRPVSKMEGVETTILEAWKKQYPKAIIPRELVIDLPEKASGVFGDRSNKIRELRDPSLFKEGLNLNDAMKELDMMGYSPDMKSQFLTGDKGEPINGGLVAAWSYYMPLKHKVKYKMQARGFGKYDIRTKQPNQGRNKVGGLRFNYMDALAVIKSGAAAMVSDRLLESSSKQDVLICKSCEEICHREGEESGVMGSIVCPICKNETSAIKISIPYSFILMRMQAMGAGMRLRIKAAVDPQDDDE